MPSTSEFSNPERQNKTTSSSETGHGKIPTNLISALVGISLRRCCAFGQQHN
jgi:hypothetical protein